jgi:hypothetical protein
MRKIFLPLCFVFITLHNYHVKVTKVIFFKKNLFDYHSFVCFFLKYKKFTFK